MPPKKQKTQEEIRGKSVKIRVNELEHEEINRRANMYGVTTSTYIRNIALNYPITSKVDHLSLMELGKCRADLGRLGGLLKMWLSNKDRRAGLDEIEVKSLYKEIEAKQEELIELARKLTEITK
jgi:hypothetical protein